MLHRVHRIWPKRKRVLLAAVLFNHTSLHLLPKRLQVLLVSFLLKKLVLPGVLPLIVRLAQAFLHDVNIAFLRSILTEVGVVIASVWKLLVVMLTTNITCVFGLVKKLLPQLCFHFVHTLLHGVSRVIRLRQATASRVLPTVRSHGERIKKGCLFCITVFVRVHFVVRKGHALCADFNVILR